VNEVFTFLLITLGLLVIAAIWLGLRRVGSRSRGHFRAGYGGQMELDMRLPYKRFKQLYPYSKMTYQEYKQLQMKSAFRRAVSSEKNKRMVR
jgi:hypothetical protein